GEEAGAGREGDRRAGRRQRGVPAQEAGAGHRPGRRRAGAGRRAMSESTQGPLLDDDRAGGAEPDRPMLAVLLAYQRRAWRRGERAALEAYLAQYPALAADDEAVPGPIYPEILPPQPPPHAPPPP